jgi:hypothetical protein
MAKLSQQHFHLSLTRGYYGYIPSPLSTTTTRKNDKSVEHPQRKKKKAKKAGPSSDVYMSFLFFLSLLYNVFLTVLFATLSNFVVYQESVLHLLHPCSQIFQKNLNREASF